MAMHNSVYPGRAGSSASKFPNRSASPTFVNYPVHSNIAAGEARSEREAFNDTLRHQDYHHSLNANQKQQLHPFLHNHQTSLTAAMTSPTSSTAAAATMMKPLRPYKMRSNSSSGHQVVVHANTSNDGSNGSGNNAGSNNLIANLKLPGGGSLGHHRGDLIFSEDLDTIEFCMPSVPSEHDHRSGTMHGSLVHGINNEMFVPRSENGLGGAAVSGAGLHEAFTERRRRSHARRSNHKIEVEQQVNI